MCWAAPPVRPPVRPQDPRGPGRYEAIKHEAVLVAEMLRATPTAPSSLNWPRWLTSQGVPTRTGKHCWDRSLILGHAAQPPPTRPRCLRQDPGHPRANALLDVLNLTLMRSSSAG
jgi:hypothetical protein